MPKSDRAVGSAAQYAADFRDLQAQFEECLNAAEQSFEAVEWYVNAAHNLQDLQGQGLREHIAPIAGPAQSYREVLQQLLPRQPLTREGLAEVCGYYLIPQAVKLLVSAARRGLLREPRRLCRTLALSKDSRPRWDSERREFWRDRVLPALREFAPDRFAKKARDRWHAAREKSTACEMPAELIEASKQVAEKQLSGDGARHPAPRVRGRSAASQDRTFSVSEVLAEAGISNSTLNSYAKKAGVKTPGRGKRNHRYSLAEVKSILDCIVRNCNTTDTRQQCESALSKLDEITQKS